MIQQIERQFVRSSRPLYGHLVSLLESAIARGELPSGARLPLLTRADMRDDESARIYDALSGPAREPPAALSALRSIAPRPRRASAVSNDIS